MWWQYAGLKSDLYATASQLPNLLVRARVSDTHAIVLVPSSQVFSDQIVVFGTESTSVLAVLQSTIHEAWARKYGSTLKGDMRYSPSDCYDNFPFPENLETLQATGNNLQTFRSKTLVAQGVGLTSLYHKMNDPAEASSAISTLRDLHLQMDLAVAAAYGWSDLDFNHDFYETDRGTRFTIGEAARREVLQRLLKLNHEQHERELKQGQHEKQKKLRVSKKDKQTDMFDGGDV